MSSERQVKELASKNKKLINNKTFFRSKTVNRYFLELAEIAVRKRIKDYNKIHLKPYSRKTNIKLTLEYDRKNSAVAYAASSTNNKTNEENIFIFINVGHQMFEKVRSREELLLYAKGLLRHEIGHLTDTNYSSLNAFKDRIEMGRLFPDINLTDLTKRSEEFQLNYEKLMDFIKKDRKNREEFYSVAAELHNCGEDGYIEEKAMEGDYGTLVEGLYALREFDFDSMPTIDELEERIDLDDGDPKKIHIFNAISQIYLCYAKYGEFKYTDDSELESEIVQAFIPCIKDLDRALASSETSKRMYYMNNTMVTLWPYIESYLEYLDSLPEPEESSGSGSGSGRGSGKSSKVTEHLRKNMKGASSTNDESTTSGMGSASKSPEESSEKSKSSSKRSKTKEKLGVDEEDEETKSGSSSSKEEEEGSEEDSKSEEETTQDGSSEESSESDENSEDSSNVQEVTSEKENREEDPDECEEIDRADAGEEYDDEYEGSAYDKAAEDIERLLNEIATEKAEESLEESRLDELNTFGKNINYGDKHRGMKVVVRRISSVPDYLIETYKKVAPELIALSKQLQKRVSQKLKDRRRGGKETNLYFGRKLEARTLYRKDGRHFYKNKIPNNEPQMCVGLLIDESGSMSSNARATYARALALIIYDFCTGLDIPITVYGHTADEAGYGSLNMHSYAEFDAIDKKDRYRIMDICARSNNRDGAALKYMFEKLDKRPENMKIMFVISDGRPYSSGYSGLSAEEDCKTIVDTYRRKGITTIAAAIGSDKPNIEKMYGKEGFLDITDLNKLPVILTNILIKNLKL